MKIKILYTNRTSEVKKLFVNTFDGRAIAVMPLEKKIITVDCEDGEIVSVNDMKNNIIIVKGIKDVQN